MSTAPSSRGAAPRAPLSSKSRSCTSSASPRHAPSTRPSSAASSCVMKRPTFTPDRLDVRASERHTWPGEAHSGPIDTDEPQLTTWPGRWPSTMLESGAIQARGGTLPGRMLRARSLSKAAAVRRHVHGIGIQIGSYPCRTHDKRNRPRLWVKPRWRGFSFSTSGTGVGPVASPRPRAWPAAVSRHRTGHELFNDRLMSS